MEFSTIINKQANFYFFIQNLSEWHFSCRKQHNIFWEKELGGFSKEENNALKKFREIHTKYPFGKSYLGRYFFIEKNPWKILKEKLSKEEYEEIKNIFNLLKEKFEKLYKKNRPNIKNWQNILNKNLNAQKEEINNILGRLYNTDPLEKNIDVYLLFSSEKQNGGGANIGDGSVSVEVSRCPFNQENRIRGIIWHELIHLYFEKGYFLDTLHKEFEFDEEKISYIKEIIDSLLFPNGVLGKSILGVKRESLNSRISIENKGKLLKLTERYVEEKRKFDEKYIKKINNYIENK